MVDSRENLLKQIDGLRELVRRVRRLADGLSQHDRHRLLQYAEELSEKASRLEKQAADGKPQGQDANEA